MIDRNSIEDAEKIVNEFLPDRSIREILLNFLADSITYSHSLDCANWSLNLDKDGKFIRFNIGQVYCVTIYPSESLVLCLRNKLKKNLMQKDVLIDFVGYEKKKEIRNSDIDKVPDCLVMVPDSVGCYFKHEKARKCLEIIKNSNRDFIKFAIKRTNILPNIRNAHSTGIIEYISRKVKKSIPNPLYSITEGEYCAFQDKLLVRAKKMTDLELEEKSLKKTRISEKIKVTTIQYVRNPFVSELAKRKANGICQDCKQPAPFLNKLTNEPYLECHHIIPLSEGGLDVIENVIALCPNCHKKRHYG